MLDIQKQGFLNAFTLDFFLRDPVLKIKSHDEDDETTTLSRYAYGAQLSTGLDMFALLTRRVPLICVDAGIRPRDTGEPHSRHVARPAAVKTRPLRRQVCHS